MNMSYCDFTAENAVLFWELLYCKELRSPLSDVTGPFDRNKQALYYNQTALFKDQFSCECT